MHNSLYVAYHFMSTCIVTMYTASHCCYLLLHTVQFTFVAVHRPVLLFVAKCYTVAVCWRHMPYSCYWFHTVCCHMLHSLLFVAMFRTVAIGAAYRAVYLCCRTPYSSIFITACHAVCYLLLHVPYSLLLVAMCHTVAIGAAYRAGYFFCHTPYSSIFVTTCHAVCYLLLQVPYSLLFVVTSAIQFAIQFTVRCHVPYSCYWCCIP